MRLEQRRLTTHLWCTYNISRILLSHHPHTRPQGHNRMDQKRVRNRSSMNRDSMTFVLRSWGFKTEEYIAAGPLECAGDKGSRQLAPRSESTSNHV